jgi:hypothetical protein
VGFELAWRIRTLQAAEEGGRKMLAMLNEFMDAQGRIPTPVEDGGSSSPKRITFR